MKTGNTVVSSPIQGDVAERVATALRHAAEGDGLAVTAVPVRIHTPEALIAAAPATEPAVLWDPPDDALWCGVGVAAEIAADGPGRFHILRTEAERLWSRIHVSTAAPRAGEPPQPRLFGGAAFAPGPAQDAQWRELGDARFVLPRFTAVRQGDSGWLLVAAPGAGSERRLRELGETAERLVAALESPAPRELSTPHLVRRRDVDRDRWQRGVEAIRRAIAAGEVEKVVSARWSELELDAEIDLEQVLLRLAHECPGCTRFVLRLGGIGFVSATPERLVARAGRRVTSQALAGSMATAVGSGNAPPDARLLACPKNREEHQLVVDSIRDALAPLCRRLSVPEAPTVRALRRVLHLASPMTGELERDTHVLELVAALHPTAAVGGVPKARALQLIAEQEPLGRGWYAGPIGWFDASGDGDFAVAIRSALVRGARARVYAGAGIVRGSTPVAEYRETLLKQGTMVHGLGLDWESDECFGPS